MPRAASAFRLAAVAAALLGACGVVAAEQVQVTLRDTEKRPVEARVIVEYVVIGANFSGGSKPKPHETVKGVATILCTETENMFTMVEVLLPPHSLYFFDTSQAKRRCAGPIMEFWVNINRRRDISRIEPPKVDAPGPSPDLPKIEGTTIFPRAGR